MDDFHKGLSGRIGSPSLDFHRAMEANLVENAALGLSLDIALNAPLVTPKAQAAPAVPERGSLRWPQQVALGRLKRWRFPPFHR